MEKYKLIPMSEIRDDVRMLAVAWGEKLGYRWIGDKHKFASDIQNLIDYEVSKTLSKPTHSEPHLPLGDVKCEHMHDVGCIKDICTCNKGAKKPAPPPT